MLIYGATFLVPVLNDVHTSPYTNDVTNDAHLVLKKFNNINKYSPLKKRD